jgi:hypothetical protein
VSLQGKQEEEAVVVVMAVSAGEWSDQYFEE